MFPYKLGSESVRYSCGARVGLENTDHSFPSSPKVRVIYFLEKTEGVNLKRPTLGKNSPILSIMAINRNHVFCALNSRM